MAQEAKKKKIEQAGPLPGKLPWMIKVSDYTEIKYWVSCTNTTTKTDVPAGKVIEIAEFGESSLLLRMPTRTCAFGHLLILQVERRHSKPFSEKPAAKDANRNPRKKQTSLWVVEDKILLTAKVSEVEALGKDLQSVTVQLYQFDQDHWKKFLSEHTARQAAVTRLVRRMSE